MNELQFGNRIRHLLNQGLRLDAAATERLQAARKAALERQRPEPAPALRWADNVLGGWYGVGGWGAFSARVALSVLVLAAAALGISSWQEKQRLAEIVEIDAQLLTDDLPIDAYLDRGFQNWLKKRADDDE
jgi:hypothetical protein